MAKRKGKRKSKPSKVFGVPAIVGVRPDISRALRVGKDQIHEANEFARSVGCGTPFGADGHPVMDRAQKKRYMRALNERRVDQGEARLVNHDGGYGDET